MPLVIVDRWHFCIPFVMTIDNGTVKHRYQRHKFGKEAATTNDINHWGRIFFNPFFQICQVLKGNDPFIFNLTVGPHNVLPTGKGTAN